MITQADAWVAAHICESKALEMRYGDLIFKLEIQERLLYKPCEQGWKNIDGLEKQTSFELFVDVLELLHGSLLDGGL